MFESPLDTNDENAIKSQVQAGLEDAKAFAKSLSLDQVKSGDWFIQLLMQVVSSYKRNARAEYFQQKYPGLPADEIADKLISTSVRYAMITGAVTGATTTSTQVATLMSGGISWPLWVAAIGMEMIYLAHIQIRLVLDLSVVYDLQLDLDDPEDVLTVFGYAMGIAPTELLGKLGQKAAAEQTKRSVKRVITKGTRESVIGIAKQLGLKINQRTIIKYAVPGASAVFGSSFNYLSTQSVGKFAKSHFKTRGNVNEELRNLVSRQNTYDLAFPAAVMFMAQVDGEVSSKELDLYRALLSRMSFEEHTQREFQRLIASEKNIIDAVAEIDDPEVRSSLLDALILMAVYDGELSEEERDFLIKVAGHLGVELDMADVERKVLDYEQLLRAGIIERTREISQAAYNRTLELGSQSTQAVRRRASDAAASLGSASEKMKDRWGKFRKRGQDEE